MKVNIELQRNFVNAYNKMQNDYGDEMAQLNGFSAGQLSYTDFIDNFIDSDTVADASVDGSANVGRKDIVTLINEMPKPHQKLLAFNKIFYELNKRYGFQTANEWLQAEWDGHTYLHDANTSSFVSYSYKGTEVLAVKYKGEFLLSTFEDLYDLVEEDPQLLCVEDKAYCKYTDDLYVWDKDNTWSKIIRVIKKPKTKQFRWIKSANGLSEIVTSNHPVITNHGDKEASDVLVNEDKVFTSKFDSALFGNKNVLYCTDLVDGICFRGREYDGSLLEDKDGLVYTAAKEKGRRVANPIQNRIDIDYDFGWMVGFILAEGTFNHSVSISQQDNEYLNRAISICDKRNWGYALYNIGNDMCRLQLQSSILGDVFKHFIKSDTAWTKRLNPEFVNYNKDFLKGVVAGVIDGDGTCTAVQGRRVHIRVTSRALANQLAFIMRSFGFTVREQSPSLYSRKESYVCHHLIYHMAFTPTMEDEDFGSLRIAMHRESVPYVKEIMKNSNSRYEFGYGENTVLNNTVLCEETEDDYVYDVSVETGHFMCNGILSHNCFAYDLKDLAERGLFFIDNFNAEPAKHLVTFIDFVKEFVSYTSNRTSGAVGLPNLIPYMYYFWDRDIKKNYFTDTPEKYAEQNIQRLIYALNQPYTRNGIQPAFTNCAQFDRPYLEALFGGARFPDGSYMIDEIDGIMAFQKMFLETMSKIRSKNMMTYPVNSISLLRQNGKFVDEEFARYACEHNMKWNDSNLFIDSSVTSLSNCCRLKSNIEDLGYFNSIGGSALKVGSIKVNTINLARLALENHTEESYLAALKDMVTLCVKTLDCVRHIISRNVEKGLLKNFSLGIIDFEHLYNTVGFIGIYETMKAFGYTTTDKLGNTYYTEKAEEFGRKIFDVIHTTKDEFAKDKDYHINCEQIPGETAAAKLMKKDMFFFPDTVVSDLPLYGNQFIPLGIKTTLKERVRIASMFDGFCNGGSILHVNIESPFKTFDQAWNMLNYIADQGVTYFAFNTKIQACERNHAFFGKVCPECGGPVATEYTRIVGFYTPVKTYSKERKAEYRMREWENVNDD